MNCGCMDYGRNVSVYEKGVDSPKSVLFVDGNCKGIYGWYNASLLRLFFWRYQTHMVAVKDDGQQRFRPRLQRWEQSKGSPVCGHRKGVHHDCAGFLHFWNSDPWP